MASANQRKAFISLKLTFLKDQSDHFMNDVGLYINRIIMAGERWTASEDNKMGYLELGQMIDSAVVFLSEKCEVLAGSTVGAQANTLSQASGESSVQPPLSKATLGLASPSPHRQPAGPVTSTTELSYRQLAEVDESTGAYAVQMKHVLARISVIEEDLCFIRSNAEKAAGQHSVTDQQLKELLSKLLASDKKNNSSIKNVKDKISEISDTQVTLDHENETRLQSLEKQLQKLSMAQDKLKGDMECQTNLRENLVHVPDQLESVKENLNLLQARIYRIGDDCNKKYQDIENEKLDLANKVMANTYSTSVISEGQDKTINLLQELETRFQTLEADSERNLKDVWKQAERGEANFRILCQMLNDRLTPLEQLRTCLNERADGTDENIRKVHV